MQTRTASIHILNQLQEVVEKLSDESFCQPVAFLNDSSIGQHVRHSLEFFICLIKGAEKGVVNYDLRDRDMRIETKREFALKTLNKVKEHLQDLYSTQPLFLEGQYDDQTNFSIESNSERELLYTIEHTVHHMALIRVGLKALNEGCELPQDFGIASSTARFKKNQSS